MPEFNCPVCHEKYVVARDLCDKCGNSMLVGTLTCTVSPGDGIEGGHVWKLLPHDLSIGRHGENDIVVNDQYVSRQHMKLVFMDNAFFVKNLSVNRDPEEPEFFRLEHEDFLTVGIGKLKLEYILPEVNVPLAVMQSAMAMLYELHFAGEVKVACQAVLDVFLGITGLEKGYVFEFEFNGDEIDMKEIVGRTKDQSDLLPNDYQISQTVLQKVLSCKSEPLIYSDDLSNAPATSSIVRYRLKSIICVPLLNEKDQTVGIIYGDSQKVETRHLAQFKILLQTIAKLLMLRLNVLEGNHTSSFINAANYAEKTPE